MGGLEVLVSDILCEAGLKKVDVRTRTALELPGYFRATKKWDLIVVSDGALVLAMEFKSQAGKSIGNYVNNRSEEAGQRQRYLDCLPRRPIRHLSGSISWLPVPPGRSRQRQNSCRQ